MTIFLSSSDDKIIVYKSSVRVTILKHSKICLNTSSHTVTEQDNIR